MYFHQLLEIHKFERGGLVIYQVKNPEQENAMLFTFKINHASQSNSKPGFQTNISKH